MNEEWLEELLAEPELPDDGFSAAVLTRIRRERSRRRWFFGVVGGAAALLGLALTPWDALAPGVWAPALITALSSASVPTPEPLSILAVLVALGVGGALWIDTESVSVA